MIDVFEQPIMNPTFIFVDGSYFCFYRYYALTNWWKNAYPDEELNNPLENNIFVDKFKKLFIENLQQIPKKLKLDKKTNPILIVGKDCKRENIWRNTLYPQYKATRTQENGFMGGAKAILHHPQLEADDCIAVSVKHLIHKYPKCEIYIITSDKDYLQLQSHNVHLFNMAFKNIADKKSSTGNSNTDLQVKIIMGDISDNIPSVFPKCGPKTALKCIENSEYFTSKMANNADYYKQYELNKKLVCFDNIPDNLINEFMESLQTKN